MKSLTALVALKALAEAENGAQVAERILLRLLRMAGYAAD
jgi:hypothetical protein